MSLPSKIRRYVLNALENDFTYQDIRALRWAVARSLREATPQVDLSRSQLDGRIRSALRRLEKEALVESSGFAPRTTYALALRAKADRDEARANRDTRALEKYGDENELRGKILRAVEDLLRTTSTVSAPRHLATLLRNLVRLDEDLDARVRTNQ